MSEYFCYVFANPQRTKTYVGHGQVASSYNRIDESLQEQQVLHSDLGLLFQIKCSTKDVANHLERYAVEKLLEHGWVLYYNRLNSDKYLTNKKIPILDSNYLFEEEELALSIVKLNMNIRLGIERLI